jgi:hypothetical protein
MHCCSAKREPTSQVRSPFLTTSLLSLSAFYQIVYHEMNHYEPVLYTLRIEGTALYYADCLHSPARYAQPERALLVRVSKIKANVKLTGKAVPRLHNHRGS